MRKNLLRLKKESQNGFTLIELMVVVAVIAILATLGVTSFTSAIRRSRNAARQADVEAVAKGLETCFDSSTGLYTVLPTTGTSQTVTTTSTTIAGTVFAAATNACLAMDIAPAMVGYDYTIIYEATAPQAFAVCAQLEQVANWQSIGNTATLPTIADGKVSLGAACGAPSGTNVCYFCAVNQQ